MPNDNESTGNNANGNSRNEPRPETREHLSLWRRFFWLLLYVSCNLWFRVCYRYRVYGSKKVPRDGPVLIVCNHQSFLDPLLIGSGTRARPFFALARETLWKSKILGVLIDNLNAIPLDQEASDIKALRLAVDVLKANHMLLIFAEGERTLDGKVAPFEPGVMLMIRRAKPVVLPAAIEGGFKVWPRNQKLFRAFGRVNVMFGDPIPAEELIADKAGALDRLQDQVESMCLELQTKMGKKATEPPNHEPRGEEERVA